MPGLRAPFCANRAAQGIGGASVLRPRNRWRRIANFSSVEAEPSGPLEIVVVVLRLGGLGEWAKSSALLSCGVAFGTVL